MNSWARRSPTDYLLTAIMVLHVALGVLYSTSVPIFEKPDEPYHYFFIQHLVTERSLPVMDGPGEKLWQQEGTQPPLYYILAALLVSQVDDLDARDLYWVNPQRNIGNPGRPGNKNLIVHTANEQWPYQGAVLAIHVARWLSVAFGAMAVLVTFWLASTVFPKRPYLALGAAAVTAFIPQYLFISSSVSNDSLITLLSALALLQLVRLVNRPQPRPIAAYSSLGITLGLAALAKLSGLALLGLTGLVLAWLAWRGKSWRPLIQGGLIIGLLVIIIAGWWYLRNWQLYRDITGLAPHLTVMGGGRPSIELTWGSLRSELVGLRASFWGLFGWFGILMPGWVYIVLDLLTMLGGLGLVRWYARDRTTARRLVLIVISWCLLIGLSLVRWSLMTLGSQGRLLFPALPAITLVLALGWAELAPTRWARAWEMAPLIVAAGLLLLAALVPGWLIRPVYALPEVMDVEELPSELSPIELRFGDELLLHGCQVGQDRVLAGQSLPVTCYWEALVPIDRDYFIYNHLLGRDLDPIGKETGYPGSGRFPTSLWPVSRIVASTEWISVEQDARTPTLGRVAVGVFDPDTEIALVPSTPSGQELELVITAEVKIASSEYEIDSIPNPILYTVGDLAALVGYETGLNDSPHVTLYWEVLGTTNADYTVFIHLLDGSGNLVGQGDGPPVNGDYPTVLWEPGELIVDEHLITTETQPLPGGYWIAVGLYHPGNDTRLPVASAAGVPQAHDRAILSFDLGLDYHRPGASGYIPVGQWGCRNCPAVVN
jgi:4-amino-4-deoxy-L-arabinose transferase-like glycosyltransferase